MITFRRMRVSTSVKISLIMIKTCQIYAQRLGVLTTNWMANYWLCFTDRSRGPENWLNMCDGTKTFTLTPKHCKLFHCFLWALGVFPWFGTRKWNSPLEKEPITWQQCERRWHGKARELSEESTMEHVFKQSWYKGRLPSFINRRHPTVIRPQITMNLSIR